MDAGAQVRLKSDPGRQGILTGKNRVREHGTEVYWKVDGAAKSLLSSILMG